MKILSGHSPVNSSMVRLPQSTPATSTPVGGGALGGDDSVVLSGGVSSLPSRPGFGGPLRSTVANWREVTLNEAVVEIPQGILQLSNLSVSHPIAGGVAQGGIAALAMVRAVEGLKGKSVEQKMEGASSLALAVAGTVSLFPGSLAAGAANALMIGQGGIELALGVRELHEELFVQDKASWQELVTGSLDVIKGGAAFLPLISANLNTASGAISLGALVIKTALESTFVHDQGQKPG